MINTLKLAKRLTDTGMARDQAEALADELNEGMKESAVTNDSLAAAISRLRTELLVWQFGMLLALYGALKFSH